MTSCLSLVRKPCVTSMPSLLPTLYQRDFLFHMGLAMAPLLSKKHCTTHFTYPSSFDPFSSFLLFAHGLRMS